MSDEPIDLGGPIEITASIEIEDPDLGRRLRQLAGPIRGELIGGRWDGLGVEYRAGSSDRPDSLAPEPPEADASA